MLIINKRTKTFTEFSPIQSGNMSDSDDDSSNSSSDFSKTFTSKDELTASFFFIKPAKFNQADSKDNNKDDSNDDDENDDDFTSVAENNDVELFSEVVKNLKTVQRTQVKDEDPEQHSSKDDEPEQHSSKDSLQVGFSFINNHSKQLKPMYD